jgi:hypothetical protein
MTQVVREGFREVTVAYERTGIWIDQYLPDLGPASAGAHQIHAQRVVVILREVDRVQHLAIAVAFENPVRDRRERCAAVGGRHAKQRRIEGGVDLVLKHHGGPADAQHCHHEADIEARPTVNSRAPGTNAAGQPRQNCSLSPS